MPPTFTTILAEHLSRVSGRKVAEACARRFIPASLELGGKDPAIVLASADPERAASMVLRASVQATGQACQSLERVSAPGLRRYVKAREVPRVRNGLGMAILSTPQGLMTDREARTARVGGELLALVW